MIVIADWNIYPVENDEVFFRMQSWYKPPLTRAIPYIYKKDSSGYIQNRPVIFQDAQKYIIWERFFLFTAHDNSFWIITAYYMQF